MFGKNRQRMMRVFTALLTVLMILSMVAGYFALLI